MKKTALGIFLGTVLIFSGCSDANSSANSSENASANTENFVFSEPQKQPEIRGTVKSIVGNEVVVSVRDLSSLPPDVQKTMEEMQAKMKEQRSASGNGGGGMPGMGGGMGMGQRPERGGEPSAEMQKIREAMEKVKTIDTKVVFPIGISMAKRSQSGMQEISLADVKVGSSVSVWLDESITDKKVASAITVSEARKQ